jgi:hypothetical protein
MIGPATYMPGPEMDRLQWRALAVGVVALAACVAGAFRNPGQFFHSYLMAFLFWTGMALGCLALTMLQHMTGGNWGLVIRRLVESGSGTLPLMALLFVPVAFGLRSIYDWTRPGVDLPPQQLEYLKPRFFLLRAVAYFLVWLALAYVLNKWSRQQDRTGDRQLIRKMQFVSGPGLILYGLTMTFAAVDWIMSLEPRWYSTIFGLMIIEGQVLSAMALAIAAGVLLAGCAPLGRVLQPRHLHDLGKLLLAFVMVWAYLAFSQLLIMWSGNLPEEISWYLRRLAGGWQWVGVALLLFHFALPFVLLLSREIKRNPRTLARLAALVLVMRVVDLFWLTAPEFPPAGFHFHWMDIAAPVGVGGLWLAAFAWQLKTWPLLPVGDPNLAEALEEKHE